MEKISCSVCGAKNIVDDSMYMCCDTHGMRLCRSCERAKHWGGSDPKIQWISDGLHDDFWILVRRRWSEADNAYEDYCAGQINRFGERYYATIWYGKFGWNKKSEWVQTLKEAADWLLQRTA